MAIFGSKPILGIEIGTTSIKAVALRKKKDKIEMFNYGILEKYGYLERVNDAIQTMDFKLLEESTAVFIRRLLDSMKVYNQEVFMTLPNFAGFVNLIDFPEMSNKELAQAIKFQASQYLPFTPQEMVLDWQIVKKSEGKITILLVAVSMDTVKRYSQTAAFAKLNLKGLELEGVALAEMFGSQDQAPFALVDIGGRISSISIVDGSILTSISNIDIGGGNLTQVIASALGVDPFRAESLKKSYGLNLQSDSEIDLFNLMIPMVDAIKREAEKAINAFYIRTQRKVEKIILIGGGANLKGVEEYFVKNLGLPVIKGNPFTLEIITCDPKLIPIMSEVGVAVTSACAIAKKHLLQT